MSFDLEWVSHIKTIICQQLENGSILKLIYSYSSYNHMFLETFSLDLYGKFVVVLEVNMSKVVSNQV